MYYSDFFNYIKSDACDGNIGKACEMAFKSYTSGRIVKTVRPAGKKDAYVTFKVDGKRKSVTVEVKTGCGNITNAAESDYVAYWPEPTEDANLENSMVVFATADFQAMLDNYPGRGNARKYSKDGTIHIQSFYGILTGCRPNASKPLANWIYECCAKQPTVEEWLQELRRG